MSLTSLVLPNEFASQRASTHHASAGSTGLWCCPFAVFSPKNKKAYHHISHHSNLFHWIPWLLHLSTKKGSISATSICTNHSA